MASLMLRSVYAKRAVMNQTLMKMTAMRAMSSVPHHGNVNPHGWKSWKDVPDSALPPCPDPSNGLYETNVYKKLQKKRVWYQIDDGTPIYFKEGLKDRVLVYTYAFMLFSLLASEYYVIVTKVAV